MELSDRLREAIATTVRNRCPWIGYVISEGEGRAVYRTGAGLRLDIEPAITMQVAKATDGMKSGDWISIPWKEIEKVAALLAGSNATMQIHFKREEPTCKEVNAIFSIATNGMMQLGCEPWITK